MRPKTLKLVVTFHTTAAAMAMEALCKAQNLPGRLIPTPRELTADCGMAWCAPLDAEETLRALADAHHLEYADWSSAFSRNRKYSRPNSSRSPASTRSRCS